MHKLAEVYQKQDITNLCTALRSHTIIWSHQYAKIDIFVFVLLVRLEQGS